MRITYQTSLYGSTERASRFSQQKFKVDLLRLGQVVKDSGLIESFRWMHADKGELCKWELGATTFTSTWCASERTSSNAVKEPISDRLSKRLHDQTSFCLLVFSSAGSLLFNSVYMQLSTFLIFKVQYNGFGIARKTSRLFCEITDTKLVLTRWNWVNFVAFAT